MTIAERSCNNGGGTKATTNNDEHEVEVKILEDGVEEVFIDGEMVQEREFFDDCPLCLNEMSKADVVHRIDCPTKGCDFNFCATCIWNLLLSSGQDYQIASDGSKQLKVPLVCPMCRSKYYLDPVQEINNIDGKDDKNNVHSHHYNNAKNRQIVQDILLCRKAYTIQDLFDQSEDEYTATELTNREMFLQQVTWDTLVKAHARYDTYLSHIGKQHRHHLSTEEGNEENCSASYHLLQVQSTWKRYLRRKQTRRASNNHQNDNATNEKSINNDHDADAHADADVDADADADATAEIHNGNISNSSSADDATSEEKEVVTLVDLTLLRGLHYTMSFSEQQYVTLLLTSGKPFALLQGAQILHGMLTLDPYHAAQAHLANKKANQNSNNNSIAAAAMDIGTILSVTTDDVDRYRRLFPLPSLPTWVNLPVYNPDQYAQCLRFDDETKTITGVRGAPGRLGLRKGDVLTHYNLEPFHFSYQSWLVYMKQLYYDPNPDNKVINIVVNANQKTADELQKRSEKLILRLKEERGEQKPSSARSMLSNISFG